MMMPLSTAPAVALFMLASCAAAADVAVVPGELTHHATQHSIGLQWPVTGDTNHNATCTVAFRRADQAAWRDALPLMRIDYAWYMGKEQASQPVNMLAGSILFLTPGQAYDVRLQLHDPDGGKAERTIRIATAPSPVIPTDGQSYSVDSQQALAAAESKAQGGDRIILEGGDYGDVTFTRSGKSDGGYIAYVAAERQSPPRFNSIKVEADHLFLNGLHVKHQPGAKTAGIHASGRGVENVVVAGCHVEGFKYNIVLNRYCRGWTIRDNVVIGDKTFDADNPDPDHLEGEGIELGKSPGHTVCYNRISRVADGVSYPAGDCDIFSNDIFNVSDDGLEPDFACANVRMWGNRVTNFGENGISFQPMYAGPWYIIRNQLIGSWRTDTKRIPNIFKFRCTDRFVCVNNTFVFGRYLSEYSDSLFLALSRNNLFISATGEGQVWAGIRYPGSVTARTSMPMQHPSAYTDNDYNGFAWGETVGHGFRYQGVEPPQGEFIKDLDTFSSITGVEQNSKRVTQDIFEAWSIPAGPGLTTPYDLKLKVGSEAVDAGAPLPNICETYRGHAPDLGALEHGDRPPHVGPREVGHDAAYWARF